MDLSGDRRRNSYTCFSRLSTMAAYVLASGLIPWLHMMVARGLLAPLNAAGQHPFQTCREKYGKAADFAYALDAKVQINTINIMFIK